MEAAVGSIGLNSVERLAEFAMRIFCNNLEPQLELATLVQKFEHSLRASGATPGFELGRPGTLRELLDTTGQLPIDHPFGRLLNCTRNCSPQPQSVLETLHLTSDAETWKLHHLSACDALKPDVLGDELCQFLADIGAGEIHDFANHVHSFLRRLINSLPTDWYESLILAAVYVQNRELLEQIAPFGDGFTAELPTLREQLDHPITDAEFQRARSSVLDRTARWTGQNLVRLDPDTLRLTSVPQQQPSPTSPPPNLSNGSTKNIRVRPYQEELAEAAVAGQNSIVIAPTGSGKTMVAILVTQALLEREPDARVVFLVSTTNLVFQQFKEFQEGLPPQWRDRVCQIHGCSGDQVRLPFSQALKKFSVLVVSTQILLNELEIPVGEGGLGGDVSVFRLLVFDECHKCQKKHPYSKLMLHYMRQKRSIDEAATESVEQSQRHLPQILGLTASPGTGKAAGLEDAVEHLVRLCARLDYSRPVTVQRHLASMLEVTSDLECNRHTVGSKPDDLFKELINQLMSKGEELLLPHLKQLPPCDVNGLPTTVPPRGTPKYESYCSNIVYNMHKADHESSKNLDACGRYLGSYNKAQMIAQFFRSVDALSFLEQQLRSEDEMAKPTVCEAEDELRQHLNELMPDLLRFCYGSSDAKVSSPLDRLVEILKEQFARLPDSRAIVFVEQKFYARVLAEFLNDASGPGLAATFVTGAASAGAAGGTKSPEQEARLEGFRQGKFKVVSCTKVLEEGLDIPDCNLVVMFCHVTNEISRVQAMGRSRAKDGACHLIIAESQEWLAEKDRINKERDEMMREAVQRVTAMDWTDLQAQMAEYQSTWLGNFGAGDVAGREDQQEEERREFDLVCRKCRTLLTRSSRLRLIAGIHRVALDVALFSDRVRGRRGESKKLGSTFEKIGIDLVCKECGVVVAKVVCHSGLHFPLVAVKKGVLFLRADDTQKTQRLTKKWQDADAFLPPVEPLSDVDKREWAVAMPQLPQRLRDEAAAADV